MSLRPSGRTPVTITEPAAANRIPFGGTQEKFLAAPLVLTILVLVKRGFVSVVRLGMSFSYSMAFKALE
jgi:hypothetical protein